MPQHRRNLYVLSVTIFLASVSWNQVLPFLPLFLKEIGAKDHLLQWSGAIFAVQSLASIITLPFWGKMGDKYGQKQMTLRAGICLTGIYFAMSFCQTPWQLAILRFLNGALTGFIPGSIALIATNTPRDQAARSVASAQTSAAAGGIVGPAIGGLLAGLVGYRGSMQVSGFAILVSIIMVWLFVKVTKKPEPVEETSLMQDFVFSLRSPVMASIMMTTMVYSAYMTAIVPFLTLHLNGISKEAPIWLAGSIFSLPPVAFLLTAQRWTRFGERRGFQAPIYVSLVGVAICAVLLAPLGSIWTFALVFFVSGLFGAAISPSCGAIVCEKVEEGFRGRAYGMLYSASTLGSFAAPLIAGKIATGYGIRTIFVSGGIMLLFGAAGFHFLARKWSGGRGTQPARLDV